MPRWYPHPRLLARLAKPHSCSNMRTFIRRGTNDIRPGESLLLARRRLAIRVYIVSKTYHAYKRHAVALNQVGHALVNIKQMPKAKKLVKQSILENGSQNEEMLDAADSTDGALHWVEGRVC